MSEINFDEFCQYDKTQLRQIGWNEKQIQRWFQPNLAWIEPALAWQTEPNNHILTLFDDNYPFLLRQISTAPPLLFIKGTTDVLSQPQIAMVGSRDYSPYGEYWAGYFAAELVKKEMVVTSGLAIGIDGFCHQRAVTEKGQTIAVLGSGLNQIYPHRHKTLAEKIIEQDGALVSEFLPHQPPIAENFPRRNRIISGLSLGTLVVEATVNSGSLITARYAMEQGREVFALPNSLQSPYSQGCHKLIKEGALLVECIEDILEAIEWQRQPYHNKPIQPLLFEQTIEQTEQPQPLSTPMSPELTTCQQQLLTQINLNPISIDDLAKVCNIQVETLLVELLNLELLELIKQVSGGYVRK